MSQDNVDVVRRGFEALNSGDMDAFGELLDAEVILRPVEDWPEPGPFVGREAVMRWVTQVLEAFDIDDLEPISYTDAADHVVARFIRHGMGRGPEASLDFTGVVTIRKGSAVLVDFFWDHAEALAAAGLSE